MQLFKAGVNLSRLVNNAFLELPGLCAKVIIGERFIRLKMAVNLLHNGEELLNIFLVFTAEYFP